MKNKFNKLLKKTQIPIFLAIIFGFLIGGIFLYFCGYSPITSYRSLLSGIFSRPKYIFQVLIQSTPIILTGLSVAFAFKSGLFNIGAEGQYIIGVIVATVLGTQIQLPPVIHFVFVILISMLAAGIWGAFAGFLKAQFGVNEVITSIMLNWIAFYLYKHIFSLPCLLVKSLDTSIPIHDTAKGVLLQKFAQSHKGQEMIRNSQFLSDIFKTDLNYGLFIAIFVVLLANYLLYKTTIGFGFRAVGLNKDASQFSGINVKKNMSLAMFTAGTISGLAGALQITCISPYKMINLASFEGYGNEGIYVALVANCSPIGCIFSGLFFSAIKCGSSLMQVKVGTPREIISIITGLIVFFISISTIYKSLISKIRQSKQVIK